MNKILKEYIEKTKAKDEIHETDFFKYIDENYIIINKKTLQQLNCADFEAEIHYDMPNFEIRLKYCVKSNCHLIKECSVCRTSYYLSEGYNGYKIIKKKKKNKNVL